MREVKIEKFEREGRAREAGAGRDRGEGKSEGRKESESDGQPFLRRLGTTRPLVSRTTCLSRRLSTCPLWSLQCFHPSAAFFGRLSTPNLTPPPFPSSTYSSACTDLFLSISCACTFYISLFYFTLHTHTHPLTTNKTHLFVFPFHKNVSVYCFPSLLYTRSLQFKAHVPIYSLPPLDKLHIRRFSKELPMHHSHSFA